MAKEKFTKRTYQVLKPCLRKQVGDTVELYPRQAVSLMAGGLLGLESKTPRRRAKAEKSDG